LHGWKRGMPPCNVKQITVVFDRVPKLGVPGTNKMAREDGCEPLNDRLGRWMTQFHCTST